MAASWDEDLSERRIRQTLQLKAFIFVQRQSAVENETFTHQLVVDSRDLQKCQVQGFLALGSPDCYAPLIYPHYIRN